MSPGPAAVGGGLAVPGNADHVEGFLKYGGVRFRAKAAPEEINRFVRQLPAERRRSLHEVARALRDAGLIEVEGEFSTLDDELRPYLEGKPGPDEGGEAPDWSWR